MYNYERAHMPFIFITIILTHVETAVQFVLLIFKKYILMYVIYNISNTTFHQELLLFQV